MRKKQLIEQNTALFDRANAAEAAAAQLKAEIAGKDKEIIALKEEIENLKNEQQNIKSPINNLKEKVIKQAAVNSDMQYGARVIGKIIVEAARYCSKLSENGGGINAREHINLILGRTEVAKAEILEIVSSDNSEEEKKKRIDEEQSQTVDYFGSVMANIN